MYWGVIDPEGGRSTNNILLQGRLKICDQFTDVFVCEWAAADQYTISDTNRRCMSFDGETRSVRAADRVFDRVRLSSSRSSSKISESESEGGDKSG